MKDFKISLSRKAKHVRSCIQKPLPYDFPLAKCPIDVDLIESKLVTTQGWEKGGEDALRSPLEMMKSVWNRTVVTSVQYATECRPVCTLN